MTQKIKIPYFQIFLILAVILLGLWNIKSCEATKTLASELRSVSQYKDTVKYYESRQGELIAYNNTLELSLNNLEHTNAKLKKELHDLRIIKPKTVTKVVTKVEIKEIEVPYEVALPCDSFTVPFNFDDEWLKIHGFSKHTGIQFDSIYLRNDLTIAVGEKDNGFFKRNESVVSVNSQNPYYNIESLESYTFKLKEPFYDKWWFKTSIFVSGFVLGTTLK